MVLASLLKRKEWKLSVTNKSENFNDLIQYNELLCECVCTIFNEIPVLILRSMPLYALGSVHHLLKIGLFCNRCSKKYRRIVEVFYYRIIKYMIIKNFYFVEHVYKWWRKRTFTQTPNISLTKSKFSNSEIWHQLFQPSDKFHGTNPVGLYWNLLIT